MGEFSFSNKYLYYITVVNLVNQTIKKIHRIKTNYFILFITLDSLYINKLIKKDSNNFNENEERIKLYPTPSKSHDI